MEVSRLPNGSILVALSCLNGTLNLLLECPHVAEEDRDSGQRGSSNDRLGAQVLESEDGA